ncbi:MAG: metal ABC transporter ATP-binding protein [Deltaproteobacteria bacterium]|nr:metal ABC transporter ATP-binding protein [Deltaproteobacteria bacterium]MBW2420164.1 metal ABC transporter ATP-binding protein [Deltaproteobacteria bacterium]
MQGGEPVIRVRDLCFGYDGERVIDHVDLDIHAQDFLAIIGPNGGGKSTLMKLLLGLLRPWSGEIRTRIGAHRGQLGWVPQFATFDRGFPLRVSEVVMMGALGARGLLRRYAKEDRLATEAALEQLQLRELGATPVAELSGGQMQRVLIARALVSKPEILFLDEPTASIDAESREKLRNLLLELNQTIPIVIVTHDLSSLPDAVKNVACLNRQLYYHPGGEAVAEGLEKVYGCHVDLIAHGHPHRVLSEHPPGGGGARQP